MIVVAGVAAVALVGCMHDKGSPTVQAFEVSQEAPSSATVGEPFTVRVTVTTSQAVPAISLRADIDGLTLVDKGDFLNVEDNVLKAAVVQPPANQSASFAFKVKCTESISYAVTAIAQSKNVEPVWQTSSIDCSS